MLQGRRRTILTAIMGGGLPNGSVTNNENLASNIYIYTISNKH